MSRVAVLGGGPAGSFAAERLARAGWRTRIYEEKLAWEKPCGGGVTFKAYQQYPYLLDNPAPKKLVTETRLAAPTAGEVQMTLPQPLLIYARADLNGMLLRRAEAAGAQIEKTRVLGLERTGGRWKIRTRDGMDEADYCVVATGARNPLRDMGTRYTTANTMLALGYYIPCDSAAIDIQFFEQFEGYLWLFPRCGHLSAGICGRGEPAQRLRSRLEGYLRRKGIAYQGSEFYSHMLPSLDAPSWKSNRVAGEGWLAVGDAGGLVDPVTGEGLYYAMRSGDLASRALNAGADAPEEAYRNLLRREFAGDLEYASRLAKRFFRDHFLFGSVPARMIQFLRRSPRLRSIVGDLFAGTQPYSGLKSRLLENLNGTLQEMAMSALLHRVVPEAPPR
ncbi:MAG: NAD(P)/FAD-dependent oxidoreductase [Bryobacteraceae bacterium]|nr:NAD(P)/FAD-dependent oxidoreductase [Bryobacteraceae bacterium]